MRVNALVTETWRGLGKSARPQQEYLYCLIVQAATVLYWWPDADRLSGSGNSNTLFAALIALGVTLSYHSIRMGAEEMMFTDQQSFREWLLATRLPLVRLFGGSFVAHTIQTLHWMLLSAPILLLAWFVDGRNSGSLGLCLSCIFLLATVYRYAGTSLYLALGHYRDVSWYGIRLILLTGFVATAAVFPATNYWRFTDQLLTMSYTGESPDAVAGFIGFYGCCLVLVGVVAVVYARRIRLNANERGTGG